jgi:hypothetical protein
MGNLLLYLERKQQIGKGLLPFTSSSQPTGANAVCRRSKQQLQVLAVLKYLIMEGRVLLNDGEM